MQIKLVKNICGRCILFTRCLRYFSNNLNINKEISEFVKTNYCDVIKNIPAKYLRRLHNPEHTFLIDDNVARKSAELIKPFLIRNKSCILELYPGLGILTKYLLPMTSKLLLYERETIFKSLLQELKNESEYDIQILGINLPSCVNELNQSEKNLIDLPIQPWNQDVAFTIVGPCNRRLLWYLIRSALFQRGLLIHGRPEMYLFITPSLHRILTKTPDKSAAFYKAISVFFQLLFDCEILLDDVHVKSFLPWNATKKKQVIQDNDFVYLVRIIGKTSLFERICDNKLLEDFYKFIKLLMSCRKRRVIPILELMVPNCGAHFIFEGYTIYDKFENLTPNQFLDLFLHFTQLPNYKDSFLPVLNDFVISPGKLLSDSYKSEDSTNISNSIVHDATKTNEAIEDLITEEDYYGIVENVNTDEDFIINENTDIK